MGTIFNFFLKRRKTGWWMHYNYITSAALDCGLFIGMIVVMLVLSLPNVSLLNWFGNEVPFQTLDARNLAIRADLVYPEAIGPQTWS